MNIVWFWTLAVMLAVYAALDGFDLGVGAVHLWVARANEERRVLLNAIGPVWNGNEVWLLAAGGMMVVAFPRVYASGFSGFYLALMLVLWLLILRGVSIEFRHQIDHPLWRALWDAGFWLGSFLLAFLLGGALGNVIQGLPIGQDGYFVGTFALLFNPYSLLTGLLSLVTLAWHGTNYLRLKTEDDLLSRARQWSRWLFWVTAALVVVTTAATFKARPDATSNFSAHPWAILFPLLAAAGLLGGLVFAGDPRDRLPFRMSTLVITALLVTAGVTIFPDLLTSTLNPAWSLTVYNAASAPRGLRDAFIANGLGMIGVVLYTTYARRAFRGKARLGSHGY